MAGRRKYNDPRNKLFKPYISLVDKIQPKVILVENVRGFTADFKNSPKAMNYSRMLKGALEKKNYQVFDRLLDLSEFGVPQRRTRYFLLAFSPDISLLEDPFDMLLGRLPSFLKAKGICSPVTASDAISDFEISKCRTRPSRDTKNYQEIVYRGAANSFQKTDELPNS